MVVPPLHNLRNASILYSTVVFDIRDSLAMSVWGFTRPFGELTIRMHLPIGLLSVLLLFFFAWLLLLAVNIFRHNR